ncbi:MAG: Caa(3)-type oxidase subunit IV [Burkholderiaceae bacterium]|nr:Caa(3)-type oxidase subunit IV [Burkholderiaceae bacterium]
MRREVLASARTPAAALLVLLVLLAINIGCAWLPLGAYRPLIAVLLSVAMTLVLMIFCMHLRHASATLRLTAAAGFFWLSILIALSLTDFLARAPVPAPW